MATVPPFPDVRCKSYRLDGLLYGNYSCGLTLICLYAIFLAIREKETRKLAISVFVLLFFNIFDWILNITLYVRPKCMIPFLPLIIYLVAQALERIRQGKMKLSLPLALLACLPVILRLQNGSHRQNKMQPLFYADMLLLLVCVVVFIVYRKRKRSPYRFIPWPYIVGLILICTIPTLSYICIWDSRKPILPGRIPPEIIFPRKNWKNTLQIPSTVSTYGASCYKCKLCG
ncbi:MAG: hypothetical protein V8Q57_03700 [Blautia sp.]